jgi:hypothetical protein
MVRIDQKKAVQRKTRRKPHDDIAHVLCLRLRLCLCLCLGLGFCLCGCMQRLSRNQEMITHRFKAEFFLASVVRDSFCNLLFHLELYKSTTCIFFSFFRITRLRERGIFERMNKTPPPLVFSCLLFFSCLISLVLSHTNLARTFEIPSAQTA